jgi:uncharacterized protein YeaO (DUF488 family)
MRLHPVEGREIVRQLLTGGKAGKAARSTPAAARPERQMRSNPMGEPDSRFGSRITWHQFRLKRVYLAPDAADGSRVLVDRLWPRGLSRERAQIDLWCKDLAPSDALRRRFHGDPTGWDAFRAAYFAELARPEMRAAVTDILDRLDHAPVTLLFAARDEIRNNAVALKEWLDQRLG